MKKFIISYSFDIKNKGNMDDLAYWERGTYEIEVPSRGAIDTSRLQDTIRKMAKDACKDKKDFVFYANFYNIEEVKE